MKALKETSMKTGRDVVSIFLFLMLATQTLAANIVDSDLSNNAGTNKNWQNGFWFLICVALLVYVFYHGQRRHFKKVSRKYPNVPGFGES